MTENVLYQQLWDSQYQLQRWHIRLQEGDHVGA
jgi:hypothetical protein